MSSKQVTIIILYQKHSCTSWNLHLHPSGPQVQRVLLQQARKVAHILPLTVIAMNHFRRVVMHYRKNHNSVTGPTWKYPRYYFKCALPLSSHITSAYCWSLCCTLVSSQVLRVRGLRAGEGLAVRRRALVSLLQGVHTLPYQLHLCWSVNS